MGVLSTAPSPYCICPTPRRPLEPLLPPCLKVMYMISAAASRPSSSVWRPRSCRILLCLALLLDSRSSSNSGEVSWLSLLCLSKACII